MIGVQVGIQDQDAPCHVAKHANRGREKAET